MAASKLFMLVDRATTSRTFIFQNTKHARSLKEKLVRELSAFCGEYHLMKFHVETRSKTTILWHKLTVNSLASLAHLEPSTPRLDTGKLCQGPRR